ncbi:hypothetical protein M378DRAFT_372217 [Amanita muscaria Koide BX008]|uniref:Uncharacterized protein n=1 Tax=Amanita muscaria (strain Koide BX008) TaxID=946122 RepID=A0A0C2TI61_AMAMK|nr:hypothetical protein M378DRAFT_372217 [Amanita muscaria Koide BX008]
MLAQSLIGIYITDWDQRYYKDCRLCNPIQLHPSMKSSSPEHAVHMDLGSGYSRGKRAGPPTEAVIDGPCGVPSQVALDERSKLIAPNHLLRFGRCHRKQSATPVHSHRKRSGRK